MHNKKAFTLIELLVVVLIIGILAAIALPMYNKAVAKARAMEVLTLIRSIADARERHYLATGEFPKYFSDLDIELSFTERRYPGYNDEYARLDISQDWYILMGSGGYSNYLTAYPVNSERDLPKISWQRNSRRIYCVVGGEASRAVCEALGAKETNPPTVGCGWSGQSCLIL